MGDRESLADRFVAVMGELSRLTQDMPSDAPERYAIWKARETAQEIIRVALDNALRCAEMCRTMKQTIHEIRAESDTGQKD